jgi:hypothetical protein
MKEYQSPSLSMEERKSMENYAALSGQATL